MNEPILINPGTEPHLFHQGLIVCFLFSQQQHTESFECLVCDRCSRHIISSLMKSRKLWVSMRGLLEPLYSITFLICPSALIRVLPCVWTCLSFCSPSCSGRWSSVWCALCCAAPCPNRSWRSRRWCCWSWCSEEQGAPLSRRCCHPGIYFLQSWNKLAALV